MANYLTGNSEYWSAGYDSDNVESYIFRPFGRILKYELGLSGRRGERVLDFGCGSGASLSFFRRQGFDVYGVDASAACIDATRKRMPDLADHFALIAAKPQPERAFFEVLGFASFDLVTATQSLYYLSNSDLEACLRGLYAHLKPGGVIYATMMGAQCWYFDHSVPASDGLRAVTIDTPRLKVSDYFVNFTADEDDLRAKFAGFEPLHLGFHDCRYRQDEGRDFHYTFIGRKRD